LQFTLGERPKSLQTNSANLIKMKIRNLTISLLLFFGIASSSFAIGVSRDQWTFSSGVMPVPDSDWLSLTRADEFHSTASVQSKRTYGPTEIIAVDFEYISWGGGAPGADGLAIYLFDAAAPNAGENGNSYSALGYCNIAGGYIGIGLDEYGNFSQSCEGTVDGARTPNSVSIRGSQSRGYGFVKNFAIDGALSCNATRCTTRERSVARGVHHVRAYLIPKRGDVGYSVNLSINGRMIISGFDYPHAAPSSLKVGISASNGSYSNNHEIRNLRIGGSNQCAR
jgi:hypothetical protein